MKSQRPRQNSEQWASTIKRFESCDSSMRVFCEENDLALSTFSKWQNKLDPSSSDALPAFKQVKTTQLSKTDVAPTTGSSVITLTLGTDITLTIQGASIAP